MNANSKLLNNYQNDLIKSRTTPLLIELNKKDLNDFSTDNNQALAIAKSYAQVIYDKPIETHLKENEANILFIDTGNSNDTMQVQILDHLLDNVEDSLKKAYNLDIAKKGVAKGLSLALGGVIGNIFSGYVEKGIESVVDTISDGLVEDLLGYAVEEFEFTDTILSSIENEILSTIENTIIDFSDEAAETRLYLNSDAKDKIVALSKEFDPNLSGQKIFQIVSQLILSIALGMPKIIFINNPHKLDNDSIAIISLLLSISKDIKDHGKHTGVSFTYTYSDEEFQPYQELKDDKYQEVKKLLDDQRRFAGRYAMLERPSSDIPTIAVKSSVFVGRIEEHNLLNERFKYSKNNPDKKTFEVIAADPGIGKTKLVKKHIEQIRHNEANGSKLIQLTLLNQVGHSSSNTGLSSLIDSIVKEAERLEQVRTLTEKGVDYLKEKAKDTAVDSIKSMLGVNSIIEIGSSINERLDLDKNIKDFSQSANKDLDNDSNSKEKQFEQLNSAIYQLKKLSNKNELPLVLFIDDLQWIDDTSAEYIIEHFSKINNVHIISTLRTSDATTMLEQKYKNKTLNEYSLSLLIKANVDNTTLEAENIENYINNTNHLENSENIKLPGFDNKTLKELISLTIQGDDEHHTILADTIIERVSNENTINTLFAVETINMLCDEKFYSDSTSKLILDTPFRFNNEIHNFKQTLEETFDTLDKKYHDAFEHVNVDKEFEQKFNLMAYAVLEERLHILQIYFKEYGDAAVNTLLFSSLLGTPFNSTIVKNILSSLSTIDEPLLEPLKKYINNSNQCNLEDNHYEIIEEVYEILSRYVAFTNAYEYKHNLLQIFLDKQLDYRLDDVLGKDNIEAKDKLFEFIVDEIEKEEEKQEFYNKHQQTLNTKQYGNMLFYKNIYKNVAFKGFENNPDKWTKRYIDTLDNLSFSLLNIEKLKESVEYRLEAMNILKKLYYENGDDWAGEYTSSLLKLAHTVKFYNYTTVVSLYKEAIEILKNLYEDDLENWANRYTDCLLLLAGQLGVMGREERAESVNLYKETLDILKNLYYSDPERWAKNYTKCLLGLGRGVRLKRAESVKLYDEALETLKDLYNSDEDKWAEQYISCLIFSRNALVGKKVISKIATHHNEALELLREYYSKNPIFWLHNYLVGLNRISGSLKSNQESFELNEEHFNIVKELYNSNSSLWAKRYTVSMNNLAFSLKKLGRIDESIDLLKECLNITEEFYNDNPLLWMKSYLINLNNLASVYKNNNQIQDTIELYEKRLKIREKQFNHNPLAYRKSYTINLDNLASLYENNNQIQEAIELYEKALGIREKLYNENPSVWAEDYITSLNSLAVSYENVEEYEDTINLRLKQLEVEKVYDSSASYMWRYYDLGDNYLKIKDYQHSSKYFKEYFELFDIDNNIPTIDELYELIYPFVKYYQAVVRSNGNQIHLEDFLKSKIEYLKEKFSNDYDKQINIEHENYFGLRDSDDAFDNEKYEIFVKLFMDNSNIDK